ncbi:hypothetical protein BGX27_009985 [Mortierella sp. AM989]|nr:hypothetical protein BGX27_009985 [Mortierella sp. AM989]
MDPSENDAAYMSMLTRNIPGVGNTPLTSSTLNSSITTLNSSSTTTLLTNKEVTSTLTDNQRHAIDILEDARKDAYFVSEGEEPFQIVHIIPNHSITPVATDTRAPLPLPTSSELLRLLKDAQFIPTDNSEETPVECEQLLDLKTILNTSNPGAKNIAIALQELFHYDPSRESHTNSAVALYRVTLPSSATRIHLWILGWVDGHLLGLHTISIES